MTKVKIPKPVAWLRSDELRNLGEPYSDKLLNQKTASMRLSAKGTEKAAKQYGHNIAVITTEQAEAYAAARVREALEDAAKMVLECDPRATHRGIATAIRALIP